MRQSRAPSCSLKERKPAFTPFPALFNAKEEGDHPLILSKTIQEEGTVSLTPRPLYCKQEEEASRCFHSYSH